LASAAYPDLDGTGVFITGGATGIGAAMVAAFMGQGSRVVFNDINAALGEALAGRLGPTCHFLHADAADPSALQASVREGEHLTGGLQVLINNVANDQREDAADLTPDGWRKNLSINLDPVIFASQAALPAMAKRGKGSVMVFGLLATLTGLSTMPDSRISVTMWSIHLSFTATSPNSRQSPSEFFSYIMAINSSKVSPIFSAMGRATRRHHSSASSRNSRCWVRLPLPPQLIW